MTDECSTAEDCVFDPMCPFYRVCYTAVQTDHEEGNCGAWEPFCPVCKADAP